MKTEFIINNGVLERYNGREERFVIPEGVERILQYALDSKAVRSIHLPKSFQLTEDFTFINGVPNLEEITVDRDNPFYSAVDGLLYDKKQTELLKCPLKKKGIVVIPSTVSELNDVVFFDCSQVESIFIPAKLTKINNIRGFFGCFAEFTVHQDNKRFRSVDGIIYSKDMQTLVACPRGRKGDITVPFGVRYVEYSAFTFCSKLTSVTFENDGLVIGDYAFYGCRSLKKLVLPIVARCGKDECFLDDNFKVDVELRVYVQNARDSSCVRSFATFRGLSKISFEMPLDAVLKNKFYRDYVKKCENPVELYYKNGEEYIHFLPPRKENGDFYFGEE